MLLESCFNFRGGVPIASDCVQGPDVQSNTLAKVIFGNRLRTRRFGYNSTLLPVIRDGDDEEWQLLFVADECRRRSKGPSYLAQRRGMTRSDPLVAYYVTIKQKDAQYKANWLQEILEEYANFGQLSAVKVPARLKLLFSDAQPRKLQHLEEKCLIFCNQLGADDSFHFEEIEENGNEGCGFCSEDCLECLPLKRGGSCAIQVRILCPALGLFKGMIVVKRGLPERTFQLPPSMKKVGPATTKQRHGVYYLLIKACFPSEINRCVLPPVASTENPTPYSSAQLSQVSTSRIGQIANEEQEQQKRKARMLTAVLQLVGVPKKKAHGVFNEYKSMSPTARSKMLVGCADPTNQIPLGTVYLTGHHLILPRDISKVFVTRFPCTSRNDARLLPMLRARPANMLEEDWDLLESLPFGLILFGYQGMLIPKHIANGDLDGDLYFTSWDRRVFDHAECEALPSTILMDEDSGSPSKNDLPKRQDWLEQAWLGMVDVSRPRDIGQLTGKLHNLWCKDEDSPSSLDGQFFGDAYKQCLDVSIQEHFWSSFLFFSPVSPYIVLSWMHYRSQSMEASFVCRENCGRNCLNGSTSIWWTSKRAIIARS